MSLLGQLVEPCFYIMGDALSTQFDAIVGAATGIVLGYEDMELLERKGRTQFGPEEFEVARIAP